MSRKNFIRKKHVLVIAPSHKTRGGITSVIEAYKSSKIWQTRNCKWIETYVDSNFIVKFFYFIKSFTLYIFSISKYEIVHIHLSWWVSAVRKLPFFLIALLLRKKIIIHVHSSAEKIISNKAKFIYKFYFLNANCTIVLANSIKEQLVKKYRFKKIEVLLNPCFNVNKKSSKKKNNILFAGTLYSLKGYSDLIYAFAEIVKKYSDWTLTFAGNGEIEKAKELCEKLGISKKVNFTGWISGINKDRVFRESKIFCLPSYSEGFPMAILDALSYELPIVTTPVGGIKDIFEDGKDALTFEPGDIKELVEKLMWLIEDDNLYKNLKNASKVHVLNTFNLNVITEKLDTIYSELF